VSATAPAWRDRGPSKPVIRKAREQIHVAGLIFDRHDSLLGNEHDLGTGNLEGAAIGHVQGERTKRRGLQQASEFFEHAATMPARPAGATVEKQLPGRGNAETMRAYG